MNHRRAPEASRSALVPQALAEIEGSPEGGDWSRAFGHLTVMGPEAVGELRIRPGGTYVDATLGGGGHSRLILEALGAEGRLIALDQDSEPLDWAVKGWGRQEPRLKAVAGNFGELGDILAGLALGGVDGILLDLGLSSRQLAAPGRGFSWVSDEPLDMRLNQEGGLTAREVVNRYPEKELADLIWRYGEERASRRLARAMVTARRQKPLATTGELAALVARSLYRPGPPPRIHPATRTFMALRIEVNHELTALEKFLKSAPGLLRPGGRLVIISFHSLEDRLVKEAFRAKDEEGRCPWLALHKKPVTPGQAELDRNPRARSAKLRAAEKTPV
ncbi:MAG: 16S rRNA (cytosine(1402)-N(4))-methyltransferase RsmH [Candidatus Adiutrix sp.]|jgi:16S rRNA (cytosine1402-N4)-methyltransferase|nr:16S rRNA (cytosine(1402)-N(4))-methyltransferase RsmH [Candidatus Adiutrix sp.]